MRLLRLSQSPTSSLIYRDFVAPKSRLGASLATALNNKIEATTLMAATKTYAFLMASKKTENYCLSFQGSLPGKLRAQNKSSQVSGAIVPDYGSWLYVIARWSN